MRDWQSDKRRVSDNPPHIVSITESYYQIHFTGLIMYEAYYDHFQMKFMESSLGVLQHVVYLNLFTRGISLI